MLQTELELLKEFRTGKSIMEKEIRELKEELEMMEGEHKRMVSKMEERFMEEKVCVGVGVGVGVGVFVCGCVRHTMYSE